MAEPATSAPELSPLKRALLALEKMQARLNALEGEKREPIALIGIGCRFPGGIDSPATFWELLQEGRDAVGTYPAGRPSASAWETPSADSEKNRLVRQGGFLSAVDQFDPGFFGISPREAMRMDPQQRILLQVACEALESAGQVFEQLTGSATGVFIGVHSQSSDYYLLQTCRPEEMDTYTSTGSAHSIVANRLSYALDLRGPSVVVDTACSSSLVALHLACQSLRSRETSLALAGGANLILTPETSLAFSKLEFLSPDGRCKTFDASANGFVRAEGCGVVVLKRLADAQRDGDPILAVVRGTAVNQDGATNGLTAPNGFSQQAVIKAALENGRVDPAQVTFIETHGTGTPLGDPIEVDALGAVYGGQVRRALGSVKTNLGHSEAAAGIAGVIKCVLALQHRVIPPNLHFRTLNPHINLAGSAFFIPTQPTAWESPAGARFAGVSSFGFGGTNGHVILQEAPAAMPAAPVNATETGPWLLPLSARSDIALLQLVASWSRRLAGSVTAPALADLLFTAGQRRSHHSCRLAVVGCSAGELREKLAEIEDGRTSLEAARGGVRSGPPRVVWVFSGQGPQWWGMGRELLAREPEFRRVIGECAEEMKRHVAWDLIEELSRPEQDSRVNETEIAQPALFALQLALAALWRAWGIEPHAVVGHSVGEIAAACMAGVLTLPDAAKIVCNRARLMQSATGQGRMAAIELPAAEIEPLVQAVRNRVAIAALNSPTSTVVSGETAAVEQIVATARQRGARTKLLPVNYAFHSPQMEIFRAPMVAAASGLELRPARLPIYSTVAGQLATAADFNAGYWGRNLCEPVRFASAIRAMLQDDLDTFIELSPQAVLSAMIVQNAEAAARKIAVWPSLRPGRPERAQMLESLAMLYMQGAAVHWPAIGPAGRFVPLPSYPWQNQSLWLEPAAPTAHSGAMARSRAGDPVYGRRITSPGITGVVFEKNLSLSSPPFLRQHRILGTWIVPAPVFFEMVLGAVNDAFGPGSRGMREFVLHRPFALTENETQRVHLVFESPQESEVPFTIHCQGAGLEPNAPWVLHASGRALLAEQGEPASASAIVDPSALRRKDGQSVGPQAFYADFARRGAEFGPAFRVIESLQWNGSNAVAEMSLPESVQSESSKGFLHPVLWDAALQTIIAPPASSEKEQTGPAPLFVFGGCDEVRVFAHTAGTSRLFCQAHRDPAGPGSRNGFSGGVRIHTAAGALIAEISGARFLAADRKALAASATAGVAELIHEVRWLPRHDLRRTRQRAAMLPGSVFPGLVSAATAFLREQPSQAQAGHRPDVVAAFNDQSRRYVVQAFRNLGWSPSPGSRCAGDTLLHELKILPRHSRLVGRMLELLGEAGVLRRGSSDWEVVQALPTTAPVSLSELTSRFPDHRPELTLFNRCASRLGEVLRGTCDPLQLLFPAGSTESAAQVYQDAAMSRLPNALMRAVTEHLRDLGPAGGVLRILEIGAGTGGTTAHLLPLLAGRPCEYVFSDISPLFLASARERFAAFPFVRFAPLDVERPPAAQGFATGQFDLIVAANVIHATEDLRRTLGHVKSLVAPGGVVALLEGFRPSPWIDLVFGQTEGWWRFSDTGLRPSHPLLPVETWCRILRETGFADAVGIPARVNEDRGLFDQAVILAQASADRRPESIAAGGRTDEKSNWLIVGESAPPAMRFVSLLRDRGESVVHVDAAEAVRSQPKVDRVVFFERAHNGADDSSVEPQFQQAVTSTCAILTAIQALLQTNQTSRSRLWLVTTGAQPAGEPAGLAVAGTPLWGMGRVLAVEHPEIWGGLVDLDPAADEATNAAQLLGQILQPDDEDQCAFRNGSRYVPRLVAKTAGPENEISVKGQEGCYLITGGLGGLGLHMATWLANQGARRLVLIGRTPLPPRTEWKNVLPDSRLHEQIEGVQEIERRGTALRMAALDVASASDLSGLIGELEGAGWLPVRGVIHAAAAIEDRLIPQLDEAAVRAVLRPKILGALNLERGLASQPLQFFVCCSSVGSLLGQAGQANYAVANAYLDGLVQRRRSRNLPALGINWGGWYGAGFAVTAGGRRTIKSLEQRGLLGFSPLEGVAALGALLRQAVTQVAVFRLDAKKFRQSYPPGEEPALLRELARGQVTAAVGGGVAKPAAAAKTGIREQLRGLESPEARRAGLQAHVTTLLAKVLKMEASTIDPEKPMGTLGLDSLMGFELKNRCEQSLDLTLSATMAWNYPTVAALTGFLAEKLDLNLNKDEPPAMVKTTPVVQQPAAEWDELSDEQALRSLMKRRSSVEP